jgi:hypothetical protein
MYLRQTWAGALDRYVDANEYVPESTTTIGTPDEPAVIDLPPAPPRYATSSAFRPY